MGDVEKEVGAWPHYAGSVLTSGADNEASVSFAFSSRDEAERFHEAAIAMLEATTPSAPVGVDARIMELADRLVATGPWAVHISASECHELRDFIHTLAQQPATPSGEARMIEAIENSDAFSTDSVRTAFANVQERYTAPQPPAVVDEAMVERAVRAAERFSDEGQITFEGMHAALTAALTAKTP